VSLVMLAFAMLAVIRHHANQLTSQKPPGFCRTRQISPAGQSKKFVL